MAKEPGGDWRRQLLTVDFTHAWVAWAAYLAGLTLFLWSNRNLPVDGPSGAVSYLFAVLSLVGPVVVIVRVFATDFAHRTTERLLTCPVPRGTIWNLRLGLAGVFVFVPALVTLAGMKILNPVVIDGKTGFGAAFPVYVIFVSWCAWCFGPLITLLVKRPILVFSATVITPLAVAMLMAVISGLTGLQAFMNPTPETFPYLPAALLILGFLVGVISLIIAARMWRTLEVRS